MGKTDYAKVTPEEYQRLLTTKALLEERLDKTRDSLDEHRLEADTDVLTGVLNNRGLIRRTRGRDWGWWVMADLNCFKLAQDAHEDGHAYGDRILVEFAIFLAEATRGQNGQRPGDIVGRKGGDEFLVWCETRLGARKIRDRIREWASRDGKVTSAAGFGEDPETADAALYIHKQRLKETT